MSHFYTILFGNLLFLHIIHNIGSFEFVSISTAVAALSAAAYFGKDKIKCLSQHYECCNEKWILNDINILKHRLQKEVYGQHLATNLILSAIKSHLINKDHQKPLVLSLHGWTGSGKNYVSNIVAESLYKKGTDSQFVHLFVSTLHFPHRANSQTYIDNLRGWIKGNITNCPNQLFIIDEVDFTPPEVLDALKPFLDYYKSVDGVDYRKSIFLLLSNNGGNEIVQTALEFWDQGKDRDHISIDDMDDMLSKKAFSHKNGGLWHSSLIDKHLIDLYIPFLPLERQHVKLCAWDYIKQRRGIGAHNEKQLASIVEKVASSLSYYPKDRELYSVSGCKRLETKIDIHLERLDSTS